jgi:phage gpG-like protein
VSRRLDVSSLAKFSATLRALSTGLAQEIATRAAPVITQFAKESFDASQDPYGVPWAPGDDGDKITLRDSGDLEKFIKYVATGTKLRVALGVPYAKYQIGKRPVYPSQGALLPKKYSDALRQIAQSTAQEWIRRGAP